VQLAEASRCKQESSSLIPDGVTGIFHLLNPSDPTVVDSAVNGNYYQRYLLEEKAAGA
jgi:hypothetical protein